MEMKMIGICGDHCEYCPRHIATQSGTIQDFENVKNLWVRLGLRDPDFPAHEMACAGCKPENPCAYLELRECVHSKSYENCGTCDDYPCALVKKAFDKTERLKTMANTVCTHEEMAILNKAFFYKKEFLDRIHQTHWK